MGGHCPWHAGESAKRHKIGAAEFVSVGFDYWAGTVAVDAGPPVTGNVLDDGQHAALEQPLASRAAEPRDAHRLGADALPITGSAPGTGTSSTGRQSTVIPSRARSSAIRRAVSRAASPAAG